VASRDDGENVTPRQYSPTPEERDERVNTDDPADKLICKLLKAGPHPKDDEKKRSSKSS
jgi:hypothetical protein